MNKTQIKSEIRQHMKKEKVQFINVKYPSCKEQHKHIKSIPLTRQKAISKKEFQNLNIYA